VTALRTAGCVFAEEEAQLLADHAANSDDLSRLLAQRVAGAPLEHVLGWTSFCGLRIAVSAGVFVPRRRTEQLVTEAVRALPFSAVVVEACCGSGAVAAALLSRRPDLRVHAVDIDPTAVADARRNVEPRGGRVYCGDLYAALPGELRGRVDAVVANAPYVPTAHIRLLPPEARLHEPLAALDGGPDGLDLQRRVLAEAATWLAPRATMLLETSAAQASASAELLVLNGFAAEVRRADELGGTVAVGRRTPA
jgi:release factor glutamine methyltransferase